MRYAALGLLLMGSSVAWAVGEASPPAPLLGERLAGPFDVSFKPFSGGVADDKPSPGEIARYIKADKNWLLTFSRLELPTDQPLRDLKARDGTVHAGYLSAVVARLRSGDPDADVLRNDIIDLGDYRVGILNAVTHERKKPILMLEALVEITPRLYYALVLTCPLKGEKVAEDPAGREAVAVFKAIVDSIEKVDQTVMKREQDERLYRTRGLFARWGRQRVVAALQPTRYLRLKQEGKDVGYVYAVEQAADGLPKAGQVPPPAPDADRAAGVRLGLRTHLVAADGKVLDTETWNFVTFDRKHEVWNTVTRVADPKDKTPPAKEPWFSELGSSDLTVERRFDRSADAADYKAQDAEARATGKEVRGPNFDVQVYKLRVSGRDKAGLTPAVEKDLPPWYLPQAYDVLLPRLVPLDYAAGYLFACYQSQPRQVMMRYVDVSPAAEVTLDGRRVRAVAVAERVGYMGTPATHLLTPDGQYLGTKSADGKTEIVASTKVELQGIWKDLDLREPEGTK